MEQMIIETKDLEKIYKSGEINFPALKKININVSKGEFTGIVGPSGSGKTTFLNIIGLLDKPTSGEVIINGEKINDFSNKKCAIYRKQYIGFVFQSFNLLPAYTVYENVELPLLILKTTKSERQKLIMNSLELVGLQNLRNKKPSQLSGGESQRVAIARAIVKNPHIILADEPTASLDAKNAHLIMETMLMINKS